MRLLIDIYANAQSCIQLNGKYTDSFLCSIGVRQGCPLSPILFTLFTHDLLVEIRKVCGIKLGHRKVSGLMFADDLVLLADNPQDLQAGLNALQEYCSKWALTVNHNKTKVLILVGSVHQAPLCGHTVELHWSRFCHIDIWVSSSLTLARLQQL